MARQGGLGRGLSALIPAAEPGSLGGDTLRLLPLDQLVPNRRQPREHFDERALQELALSLQQVGMLQPILVRHVEHERYEIVAGERRHRAAAIAGLPQVPVIVRQTDDTQLLTEALVENLHRTDLNPLEEAAAYRQLLDDLGMTHDQLAERLGRSRSTITNALRLLGLSPAVQHKLIVGSLSAGHARALLALDDPEQQQRAAQRVIADGLSVRATEELVRFLLGPAEPSGTPNNPLRHSAFEDVQARLGDALATRVRITGSGRRGRVVIDYAGREDLERLLAILGRGSGVDVLSEDA